jgi:hypothetical protein
MSETKVMKVLFSLIYAVTIWALLLQAYCGAQDLDKRVTVLESHVLVEKVER